MKTTLALVAATVAACSSGGGGPPAPVAPELTIVSMSPPAAAVVAVDATVAVVFGEDMDETSLTDDALRVEDGSGPLAGTLAYDAPSRTLTFQAVDPLPLGMPLRAVVTPQARAQSGHTLHSERAVAFGVVDGAMQPAFPVGTGPIGPPRCAAMQRGRALLAHGNRVWNVDANRVIGNATLADPVQGLQYARSGNAAALGLVSGISSFRASVSTSLAGDVWSAPLTVVDRQQILAGIELVGNGRGDLAVHWTARTTTQPSATAEGVLRTLFDPGLPVQSYAPVEVGPASLVRSLDLDGEGRLFHGVPDPSGVRVLRVDGNGAQLDLPVAPPGSTLIGVRADGVGRMLALYQTGNGNGADLRSRRFDPATGLGQEKVCFAGNATVAAFACGERGDGAVVLALSSGVSDLWAASYVGSTGEWTPAAEALPGAVGFFDGGVAVAAVSPRGIAWLACVLPQPGNTQELVLLRAAPGGAFGTPMHVETGPPGLRFLRPALAADTGGRAVVFWQLRDLTNAFSGELRAASFR
jgi:hypothetical protein